GIRDRTVTGVQTCALPIFDRSKPKGVAELDESSRHACRENGAWLAYVYRLGTELMDIERWSDAEVALDELIALSKAKDDFYFLRSEERRVGKECRSRWWRV